MMIRRTLSRLRRARRGAVGVMVAVMTMAIFAVAGVSVDTSRAMFVRDRLVAALDASALAGGRVINSGQTQGGMPQYQYDALEYLSLNFPTGYFGTTVVAGPTVTLSTDGTQLSVSESVSLPLMFGPFIGQSAPLKISYTATALAGKVEVAMVLDNTGSMYDTVSGDSQSKITLLKAAATNFVSSLLSLGNNNVRISLVPFTMTVNVIPPSSSGITVNTSSSWLDPTASYMYQTGWKNAFTSPASAFQDIFTSTKPVNRFTLLSNMGTTWAGCVEMRPAVSKPGPNGTTVTTRYDVSDTPPVSSDPASMIVPFFAPSEPSYKYYPGYNSSASYPSSSNPGYYNVYLKDAGTDDTQGPSGSYTTAAAANGGYLTQQGDTAKYVSSSILSGVTLGKTVMTVPYYNSAIQELEYALGPNSGCVGYDQTSGNLSTLAPVVPLTSNQSNLNSGISSMIAMGNTYIPIGMFWGWQTLSPSTVYTGNPSGAPASYTNPDITKVVILLTDGCNELTNLNIVNNNVDACGNHTAVPSGPYVYDNDQGFYMSAGYNWQNKLGMMSNNPNPGSDPSLVAESDREAVAGQELVDMCNAMKAQHIQIYTIGIGAAGSKNSYLTSCATGSSYNFMIADPSTLSGTFQQIADQLTTVRVIPTLVPPS